MFQGYSQETVDFMWGIRFNNERGWFLAHKDDYAVTMTRYRQQIDRDPKTLEKLVRQFDRQQVFQLTGPDYVRSKGQVSDLLRPWYQKKSLTLAHEVPLDESLYSPAFAARVTEDLKTLLPFYRYFAALCAAAE